MARLRIEVVYATPARQEPVFVEVEEGARAIDALRASGLPDRHPEILLSEPAIGIFGKRVRPTAQVQDGDRVEIYRPVMVDPKALRRKKAFAKRRADR